MDLNAQKLISALYEIRYLSIPYQLTTDTPMSRAVAASEIQKIVSELISYIQVEKLKQMGIEREKEGKDGSSQEN